MKVIPDHYFARKQDGGKRLVALFSSGGPARDFAGSNGVVEHVHTAYIFDSLEEKELFESRAGRFSEDVAFLELGLMLSDRGLRLINLLIQKRGVENVKKFLDMPVIETDMEVMLLNRFGEAKLETVLDVIKINTENDFLKFRQFGKGALGNLKRWLGKNGLDLNMFIVG